jgi:hypothetical protein
VLNVISLFCSCFVLLFDLYVAYKNQPRFEPRQEVVAAVAGNRVQLPVRGQAQAQPQAQASAQPQPQPQPQRSMLPRRQVQREDHGGARPKEPAPLTPAILPSAPAIEVTPPEAGASGYTAPPVASLLDEPTTFSNLRLSSPRFNRRSATSPSS